MEWFPTIAQIILEQLKQTNIVDCKKESFITTGNVPWTPGSRQSVEDHIKEMEIMREVALIVVIINEQVEEFSKSPFTNDSIKSQRMMLFSKDSK